MASSSSSQGPPAGGGSSSSCSLPLPTFVPHPATLSETARQLIIPQAAAVATVLTKSVLHPIDTIKIRVQAKHHGSLRALYNSYKGQWGVGHLYAGLPIKLLLYAPYQSLYMTAYMWSKPLLYAAGLSAPAEKGDGTAGGGAGTLSAANAYSGGGGSSSSSAPTVVRQNKSLEAVTGALIAEFSCAFIRVPMEVMKVRLQASVTKNTRTAARDFVRQGLSKTSRLFVPQTLCHDLPYSVTQWLVYEHVRPVLDRKAKGWAASVVTETPRRPLSERAAGLWTAAAGRVSGGAQAAGVSNAASPLSSSFPSLAYTERAHWWFVKAATFCVGMSSGLVAGIVTVPLDNIKTRVIVASNNIGGRVPSFVGTARAVVRTEGVRGMLRGGSWRVLWISSNTACFFPIFDCVKEALMILE